MEFRNEYAFLGNFYPSTIRLWHEHDECLLAFTCAEAAFQALKDPDRANMYQHMSGATANQFGRTANLPDGWNDRRGDVMYRVVYEKFVQNPGLLTKLVATGDTPIRNDNDHGDAFWGVCNGIGENRLGEILMDVRKRLSTRFLRGERVYGFMDGKPARLEILDTMFPEWDDRISPVYYRCKAVAADGPESSRLFLCPEPELSAPPEDGPWPCPVWCRPSALPHLPGSFLGDLELYAVSPPDRQHVVVLKTRSGLDDRNAPAARLHAAYVALWNAPERHMVETPVLFSRPVSRMPGEPPRRPH